MRVIGWVTLLTTMVGCASGTAHGVRVSAPIVRSSVVHPRSVSRRRDMGPDHPASATGLVEKALHQRGIRFGTDGSPRSLFAFLQAHYPTVTSSRVANGDVLFFDMGDGCGEHTAIVESVENGRLGFREWRDGDVRDSFLAATRPHDRRDEGGRVLNTFLRIKHPDDPPGTRYFAGEMLCSVIHPSR